MSENRYEMFTDNEGYYIILLHGMENPIEIRNTIAKILNDFWNDNLVNVYILTETLHLYTYWPFEGANCGIVKPVVANVLREKKFVPKLDLFKNKLKNMHGCKVTVITSEYEPFVVIRRNADDEQYLDGVDGKTINMLASQLNFSVNVLPIAGHGFWDASWSDAVIFFFILSFIRCNF